MRQSIKRIEPMSAPVRQITVGAFYDRLGDKHSALLALSYQQEQTGAFDLKAVMQRVDRSEYIDLDDTRLADGLNQTGLFTEDQLSLLFADGHAGEVPEVLKMRGM